MVVSPAPCRELLVTDCRPLEQIRTDITALDSELLTLLARRRNLSLEVACSKIRDPHPVRDRQREEALLLRLISAGRELGLDAHYITRLFHVVIEDSVLHQQAFLQQRINSGSERDLCRVAFLGPRGSYSHLAMQQYFSRRTTELVEIDRRGFRQIVEAVESGQADYAMLPIENTSSGSINEVYDVLQHTSCAIVGELTVPVEHCLMAAVPSSEAQIRTALRFAQLAASPAKPAARRARTPAKPAPVLDELIERQLKNADLALGRKPDLVQRPSVTQYSLDMLNVESRYELPRVIAALKARGHGCLCFHGAPGTGKTALAEHLAQQLERPLMIRRASDLVSKFVGETEQQMAAMFREAEAEKAVLLLDEADSFLQDRRGAQRTYEVTEVNEMLQGMERFAGIFICTTNLMDSIDQAALRRFTFKIRFKPLTAAQRETMFVVEALGGDATRLDATVAARLAKLDQLCPGDFAAVKRQVEILAEALAPIIKVMPSRGTR